MQQEISRRIDSALGDKNVQNGSFRYDFMLDDGSAGGKLQNHSRPARRLECYDDALRVDHLFVDILNTPQAVAAILAAAFALVSGIGGPLVALLIGSRQAAANQTSANAAMLTAKTAGFREIAKLRMSWMDTLRDTLAEYHAILMTLKDKETIEAIADLDERKTLQKANQEDFEKLVLTRHTTRFASEQG